jgi:hypothetical protein
MATTRRAQILMEPDEYGRLEEIARRRGVSVGSLVREAVRDRYLTGGEARRKALAEIYALDLPVAEWGDWKEIEEEIERGHRAALP